MTAQPIPAPRALSIARRMAAVVTTGPSARSPSINTVAAVSFSTRIFGRGFMSPLPSSSRYHGIRRTPWESTPRRFAHTRTSASRAASSDGTPAAMNTLWVNSRRSAAGIRISSATSAAASGGRGAGIEKPRELRAERKDAKASTGVEEEDPPAKESGRPARGVLQRKESLRRVHGVQEEPLARPPTDDCELLGPLPCPPVALIPGEKPDRVSLDVHVRADAGRGLPDRLPDGGPDRLAIELDRHAPDLGAEPVEGLPEIESRERPTAPRRDH